jgi:signal transduction histidine kinase
MVDFVRGPMLKKFDVTVFPLRDDTSKVYAVAKYFKDVTYLAQLETEMYDAERSRVLGSIALGLAHELRNPLAVISSVAQYLKKETPDGEIGEGMEKVIRNVEVANSVIADLLNFARHKERKIEVVDIGAVLENALRLVKDRLVTQRIKVHKKIDKSNPEVWLDKSSFTHALVNFLLNAVDSMPTGGELCIQTVRDDDHVRIMVSNTGGGYPPEIIDRVLSPFSRSRTGAVDLKLPIAEDIIKSHGGSVELHNNKGVGATVTIRIPTVIRDGVGA